MAPADRITPAEISLALAGRIHDLVHRIVPGGQVIGGEWVVRNPTRHDRNPGSFRIHLEGQNRGVWVEFATGEGGDALGLVAYVLYGGGIKSAIEWAKSYLGITDQTPPAAVRAAIPPPADDAAAEAEEARRREWKRKLAVRIYLDAQERLADTPAADYLAGRGIDLAQLGRQPRALRFHPGLHNEESKTTWPALVAAINDAEGQHVATHRIWLQRREGRWKKAPLKHPKMALGAFAGGHISIWRGASGKSLRSAPAGDAVAIAEGIETALSVAIACPELRVLCAVASFNMGRLALPAAIGRVILAADNDPGNAMVDQKLAAAVAHYQAEGRDVHVAMPPVPGADWNDILQGVEG